MDRTEIVKNGCCGGCCEKFTLPVSLEDIAKMKEEAERDEWNFVQCHNGFNIKPTLLEESIKLLDMLIPLGETPICPQTGETFSERYKGYDPSLIMEYGFVEKEGELRSLIFTCRHFDKEKRICNNYENRPILCKRFGDTCKYKGCGFIANRLKEFNKMGRNVEDMEDLSEIQLEENLNINKQEDDRKPNKSIQ